MNITTKPATSAIPSKPTLQSSAQPSTPDAPRADAFEAAPAAGFTKPNYRGVFAQTSNWGTRELRYTVRAGDTLESIAKRLGTTAEALAYSNEVEDPNRPTPGQKLYLSNTFHIVKKGETYWDIAQMTGLDTKQLMALNGTKSSKLNVGQEIKVPAAMLTPEQARLRAKLREVMADSAKAYEQIYYGEGATSPMEYGNTLGWWGPVESTLSFEYSDTYDSVKVYAGEGEEEDPDGNLTHRARLANPEVDSRRLATRFALWDVLWANASQLAQKTGAEIEQPSAPEQLADGRVRYKFYDQAKAESQLTYDPKSETMMLRDSTGATWTSDAKTATSSVLALGERLGLQLPLYPMGGQQQGQ